ncbi:MAG: hypothetical protein ABIP65_04035, partial [Vicinamibacterales bacterium]
MPAKTLNREIRKPFHAYVGAVDLAVAKSRELPAEVVTKAATNVVKTTSFVFELPAKAKTLRTEIESRSTTLTSKAT